MQTPVNNAVIDAQLLTRRFQTEQGALTLFDNVSLSIRQGESVAIIGPSGSGKSTLLSLLAGFDMPDHGDVSMMGQGLSGLNDKQRAELRRDHVSFIFQSFHLLPELTALENVALPLEIRGMEQAEKQANFWLSQVGLKSRTSHYPSTLSGGEQQRVAIARAFATNPTLLFADEPTGNLDASTGNEIVRQLFELNKEQKTTLVLITHDESLAERCDRCFRLHEGNLTEVAL